MSAIHRARPLAVRRALLQIAHDASPGTYPSSVRALGGSCASRIEPPHHIEWIGRWLAIPDDVVLALFDLARHGLFPFMLNNIH